MANKKNKIVPMTDANQHNVERLKKQKSKTQKLIKQLAKLKAQQMMANGMKADAVNNASNNDPSMGLISGFQTD